MAIIFWKNSQSNAKSRNVVLERDKIVISRNAQFSHRSIFFRFFVPSHVKRDAELLQEVRGRGKWVSWKSTRGKKSKLPKNSVSHILDLCFTVIAFICCLDLLILLWMVDFLFRSIHMKLCCTNSFTANARNLPKFYSRVQHQSNFNLISSKIFSYIIHRDRHQHKS